jgi:acyl carrier protein
MSETVNKLIQLAAKRFKADPATLSPNDDFFKKLGINSLQALSLLSDLEKEFDVEIPDYELQGVMTFTALANVIEKRR